jgi:hypothetical protein
MKTGINLEAQKTVPGTLATLTAYMSANRGTFGPELLDYYYTLRGMLRDELRKPAARRASMQELSRRAFNLDAIIVQGGAVSSQVEFI